jgi:predicted alpha/beta superfamily hydrolase
VLPGAGVADQSCDRSGLLRTSRLFSGGLPMKHFALLLALCLLAPLRSDAEAALPQAEFGRIERLPQIDSRHLPPRHVDVWLPSSYPDAAPYAVLYMHDGQMLFDASTTWNGQAWEIDRSAAALIDAGTLRPFIVVGVWNGGEHRHREYFPQRVFEALPASARDALLQLEREPGQRLFSAPPAADAYLRYLVEELKPAVQARYAVSRQPADTLLMGSSMGGLISLYALLEYPHEFGGAAALSTHWPGSFSVDDNPFPAAMRVYLADRLPQLGAQRIWMDHGTTTLDALYSPLQAEVDGVFRASPLPPAQWRSRAYVGTDHSEAAWAARLADPLHFLLGTPPGDDAHHGSKVRKD